ncbi:MAG TPA: caspase family protein [Kofleriaceae bacterium]|jgi:hypothetical protein
MRLLLALAVLAVVAKTASAETVSYAISIGNNAPPPTAEGAQLTPLRYADDDSVRFNRLFTRFTKRAFLLSTLDEETQRRYPGLAATTVRPTFQDLMVTVGQLKTLMAQDREKGDRPILYLTFSGHGAVSDDGTAYLALEDGRLTQQALYESVIDALPAYEVHLIVDACHAGGVVGVRGPVAFGRDATAKAEPVEAGDALPFLEKRTLGSRPQVGALVATTLGQEAHEWSRFEGGVFSHEVLSALAGAADVNGDRKIEYTEVEAFVTAANRDIRDAEVTPRVVARAPRQDQNAALVDLDALRGVTVLKGNVARLGHFFIELDTGERYLDAHLTSDASVVLVIPMGATAYVRNDLVEALVPHKPTEVSDLTFTPRSVASRGSTETAYRTALFASAYGATYYRGFVDSVGAVGVTWPQMRIVIAAAPTRTPIATLPRIMLGSSVATGAIAIGSLALVFHYHSQFESAGTQRDAKTASDRYERWGGVAVGAAVISVATGVLAYELWPRHLEVRADANRNGGALTLSGGF